MNAVPQPAPLDAPGAAGPCHFAGHDGLQLAADVAGDPAAAAVLFLHGAGQTRHSWGRAATRFAGAGWRTIALDLRGHGDSQWPADGNYSLDAFVGDALAVARAAGAPPVLVGASLGGATSLMAIGEAVGRGEPVPARALVLVDVVARMARSGSARIHDFMQGAPDGFASLDEAADSVARYLPHRPRPASNEGLRRNLREGPDGRWRWHWDPAFMSGGKRRIEEFIERMEAAARHVTVPVLIVRGASSELVDPEGVARLRELIPHAEAVDVAGAGHMVAGDRNDAFNAAVGCFLAKLSGPAAHSSQEQGAAP